MSTEISLNCFQYCLFRSQMLSGFFLDFWMEKVLFEGDITTAKPSLINQERAIWHLFLYHLQWAPNVSEENWPMEMHVLSFPSCLALSLLLHPAPISSSTMLDPNQVIQLVWVGSELLIVPKRMWFPSLQGLPELFVQIMAMPREHSVLAEVCIVGTWWGTSCVISPGVCQHISEQKKLGVDWQVV